MTAHTISRRSFIALTVAVTAAPRVLARALPATPAREGAASLAGRWRFALDAHDVGAQARWFAAALPGASQIALPGILQTQGYGDEISATTPFVAALPRDMRWYLLPQYKAYTKPGNVQVPYLSQPVRHYLGVAWYQREIEIPPAWRGKRVALMLERARWHTSVYVDDVLVGSNRSLVAPHAFELGLLGPGKHRLSIRIDNRMQQPAYRADGHAVSDAEGSTWNGIVGRLELSATSPVWIADAQVGAHRRRDRQPDGPRRRRHAVGRWRDGGGALVRQRWHCDARAGAARREALVGIHADLAAPPARARRT
jgi:beta-galactosidase